MEKKLNDEEIVKALEICAIEVDIHDKDDCKECPYFMKKIDCVTGQRSEKDILALIHRLQERVFDYENLERQAKKLELENIEQKAGIERLTEERYKYKELYETMYRKYSDLSHEEFYCMVLEKEKNEYLDKALELQKQVDELKEKIMNLKSAMIDRVARKSYDSLLTTIEDVDEIFGDAYESEFNEHLGQAIKDTAKEILQDEKEKVTLHMNEAGNWVNALDEDYIDELANRYGVEVE